MCADYRSALMQSQASSTLLEAGFLFVSSHSEFRSPSHFLGCSKEKLMRSLQLLSLLTQICSPHTNQRYLSGFQLSFHLKLYYVVHNICVQLKITSGTLQIKLKYHLIINFSAHSLYPFEFGSSKFIIRKKLYMYQAMCIFTLIKQVLC